MAEAVNENPTTAPAPLPAAGSGSKIAPIIPVLVSLIVVAAVVGVFVLGKTLGLPVGEAQPTPPPEAVAEEPSPSPAAEEKAPAATEAAEPDQSPPLSAGSSVGEIGKDINSTTLENFDADFTDLRNDASGL